MSSSTLGTIQTVLTLYGNTIFMILGNIGNVFIVMIFSRQRENPCAIYLISSAVLNSVYLTFADITGILIMYYPGRTMGTIFFCKMYAYAVNVMGQVPKTMIVFACIDRFLITSTSANFRAFSTLKRAKYFIFFSIVFWALFATPAPIMTTIINGRCTAAGVASIIYSINSIIFIGFVPTILSAVFGYLSYRNMRQIRVRVQPLIQNTGNANIGIQRRDRDLLIIVIAEVFVYVVTTALFPIIQSEMMISGYAMPNKSAEYSKIEFFIQNISYFLLFINSAAPFYTYLISSKSFRRDFKQLIKNAHRKLRGKPPVQIGSKTDRTVTQRETHV
jgi:hypothetical protein